MSCTVLSSHLFLSLRHQSTDTKRKIVRATTSTCSNIRPKLKTVKKNRWNVAEQMNSRLAMLGYVCGSIQEKISGHNYIEQLRDNYVLVLATSLLVAFSTIITKDIELEQEKKPFTSDIELLNGRMVMIGILLKFIYDGSV
tara:strand:- start:1931 stop:2353 length:423 start_codon:yes stop_codon:yes gene_type:complete